MKCPKGVYLDQNTTLHAMLFADDLVLLAKRLDKAIEPT